MTWKEGFITAIDVETTGLDPGKDKIVELGIATYHQGKIIQRHSRLINPGIPIPKNVSDIHGIMDKHVKNAPKIGDVAKKFIEYIQKADVLVAYNWPFDDGFLQAEIGDAWIWVTQEKIIIDPLVVVRLDAVGRYWKGKGRHRLENVASRFGIEVKGDTHTTSVDCEITLLILDRLMECLPDEGVKADELIQEKRIEQDADFRAWKGRQPGKDDLK